MTCYIQQFLFMLRIIQKYCCKNTKFLVPS